jgi:ATP synthase protein I
MPLGRAVLLDERWFLFHLFKPIFFSGRLLDLGIMLVLPPVPSSPEKEPLSTRLERLRGRIRAVRAHDQVSAIQKSQVRADSSALAQAVRLSAEFVSGIAAGGLLGFAADRLGEIAPFGLIIGLLLGFCAGMFNLMRAAGLMKPSKFDAVAKKTRKDP